MTWMLRLFVIFCFVFLIVSEMSSWDWQSIIVACSLLQPKNINNQHNVVSGWSTNTWLINKYNLMSQTTVFPWVMSEIPAPTTTLPTFPSLSRFFIFGKKVFFFSYHFHDKKRTEMFVYANIQITKYSRNFESFSSISTVQFDSSR